MLTLKQINHSTLLIICILHCCLSHTAYARSVYVITDWASTVRAYDIQGDQIIEQATAENLADHGGAVGLALDPDSGTLFVTFEGSNIIEMVNAKTMISEENPVTVPGASNLAGIAFDRSKNKLYVVQRGFNKLYVYLWNSNSKTLTLEGSTYKTLENAGPMMGIALDEKINRLYVTNTASNNIVRYYDTNSWNHIDSVDVSRGAVGIAVDPNRQYLYTGSWSGTSGDHTYLVRTDISDINNPTYDEYNVGAYVIGLTTDIQTGLVYITDKYDEIKIFNTATFPSDPCEYEDPYFDELRDIIVRGDVSYKPPVFDVNKVDNVNDVDCAYPWNEIDENYLVYSICYDANGFADTNVIITDHLPDDVNYISSEPCGDYNSTWHTVTWDINDISGADSNCLQLTVKVKQTVKPGRKIINLCEMEGDQYYKSTTEETTICCYGGDIIFVNKDANGFNNGTSWLDAYIDLEDSFLSFQNCECNQIWVAKGNYIPSERSGRASSFELFEGVALYGGFAGNEKSLSERNLYDPNNFTYLSGDIGAPNDHNDNSYNVVKCEDVNNAVLDGFTITAGNAVDSGFKGCGIYCKNSNNLTVRNCVISQNETGTGYGCGGGIYFKDSTNLNVTYCNFSDNASYRGGGLYNDFSDLNINNCIFSNNSAFDGGAVFNDESDPNIAIANCIFTGNTAETCGGGIYNNQSVLNVTNCVFADNTATAASSEGGGMYNINSPSVAIANCIFTGNSVVKYGGGVYNINSTLEVTYSVFTGNNANIYGGGMHNHNNSSVAVDNCIFNGNHAYNYGGGIANYNNNSLALTNCAVAENYAYYGGGIFSWNYADAILTNCIFWDNMVDEIYKDTSSTVNVTYCDVNGGWEGGVENINKDPCFFEVEEPDGSWTEDAFYDNSTFQSTLTDSYADWAVNELAGRFVNPDTLNQNLQFFIVSNDVTTINVWGNVESFVISGDPYQIYDYHLKLESACIDAGYPQGDYTGQKDIDGEPRVFDGDANGTEIVDMGADEYYWSPADFNSDGLVNFFDYALIANVWLTTPNDVNYYDDVYDLIDNNCIDHNDLARFCEDWLWQTAWAKTFPFAYETMGRSMGESLGLTQELFTSASAKQDQPELTAADIEDILKWLYKLWLTNEEVRKIISEDDWLKFVEEVIELAEQEIQY